MHILRNINRKLFVLFLIVVLLCSLSLQAGILSGLSKLGRAAKKADDVPTSTIRHFDDIPNKIEGLSVTELKPNSSGSWDIKMADGQVIDIQTLAASGVDLSEQALTLRAFDLPSDFDRFNKLPADLPVYITNKKGRAFELIRAETPVLRYNNLRIPLAKGLNIKSAFYHLDKPLSHRKTRFVQLTEAPGSMLPVSAYGSRVGIETVSSDQLIESLLAFKADDLVLSGPLKDGKLFPKGLKGQGVNLDDLKKVAADNDLNLMILDSARPKATLNFLELKQAASYRDSGQALALNTGDLFASFSDDLAKAKTNGNPLQVSFSSTGRSQVVIQSQSTPTISQTQFSRQVSERIKVDAKGIATSSLTPGFTDLLMLRTLIRSAEVIQRSQEKEDELILSGILSEKPNSGLNFSEEFKRMTLKQKASTIFGIYPFLSFLAGILVFFPLSRLLERINPVPVQMGFFRSRFDSLCRGLLMFIFVMPLLGLPMLVYKLYRFISAPVRWMLNRNAMA